MGLEVGVTCCHLAAPLQQDPFNLIGCSCFTHKNLQEQKNWEFWKCNCYIRAVIFEMKPLR